MKTTKELARELGLLRKRSATTQEKNLRKIRKTNQIFSHLIVIDFESTCWQNEKYRPNEIIEFPAVLLNTSTGEIEAEFQYYVLPQEHPLLSEFCTQLTGITQAQVEAGLPLQLVLRRFSHWLKTLAEDRSMAYNVHSDSHSHRCTFVTWSDWDLGVCLQYECRRKQLRKPAELNSWIDLRATYRSFYGRKPSGLNGALKDVGIEFEGREHSGLHDARNTARLAWRMMCDGCVMQTTKTITPSAWSTSANRDHAHSEKSQIPPLLLLPWTRSSLTLQSCCPTEHLNLNSRVLALQECLVTRPIYTSPQHKPQRLKLHTPRLAQSWLMLPLLVGPRELPVVQGRVTSVVSPQT